MEIYVLSLNKMLLKIILCVESSVLKSMTQIIALKFTFFWQRYESLIVIWNYYLY